MGQPRVLVVEHEGHCTAARLGDWLADEGCRLDVWRPYLGDPPVTPGRLDEADAVLVLGGTMDSWDDAAPWLLPTRTLIRAAGSRSIPVLGVCLGHQLCALAYGGEVGRNPHGQTVGLVPVGATGAETPLRLPSSGVFWNDDVITRMPPGAQVLAVGPHGVVQAAAYAPTVWGVQWHPEVADGVPVSWADGDADRHTERGIDQTAVIAEVAAATDLLTTEGRALAASFADLARARARARLEGPA